jgi:hypothetical protein
VAGADVIRHRLADISSKAYQHPADRAATAALQRIPKLDLVVKRLIEFQYERALRQSFLASSVKLGPKQLRRSESGTRTCSQRSTCLGGTTSTSRSTR